MTQFATSLLKLNICLGNKICCDPIKGTSRLGREYLQVGQYTEPVFPSCGVDSLYESTNDFTPFRNIINDNTA